MRFSVRRLAPGELDHELIWLSASACIARLGSCMANNRPAVAALRVSRPYQTAMRHMWNDAMRHPILSRPLSRRIQVESTHLHSALRRNCLRHVCIYDAGGARTASADLFFEQPLKKTLACLSHLCACTKLDLFGGALAQLSERPATDGFQPSLL